MSTQKAEKWEIENSIKEILEIHTYADKTKEGYYEYDLYVDYRDEISDDQIQKICKADDKMQAFYESLDEFVQALSDDHWVEIKNIIEKQWEDKRFGSFDDNEDFVIEWMEGNIFYNFPYERYLNQNILVNVLIDTGDGNYDFTLNNFHSYNASEDEEIDEESSILWLVRQQGYSKEQLKKALDGDFQGSKFLESVVQELENVTTHMNALSFFVKMTLKDYIDFTDNKDSLVLSKATNCGLYDCWQGAGSVLEIALDKDVIVPVEYIQAHIDGARGYGIGEIYGMSSGHWTDTVIGLINSKNE